MLSEVLTGKVEAQRLEEITPAPDVIFGGKRGELHGLISDF